MRSRSVPKIFMNKISKLGQLVNFALYLTLQLVVAQFVVLERTALCLVYVAFLLLLPRRQAGLSLLLWISFVVGLSVDMFYNSGGIHAFASVLMVYGRSFLLQYLLPTSDYEVAIQPTLSNLGWRRFSLFSLLLIGLHHLALFLLEAAHPMLFFVIMRKVVFSTLLTYIAVLCTQGMILLVRRR